MAITVTGRVVYANAASRTSWSFAFSATAAVGNYVIVFVYARNYGTGGAESIGGVSDVKGNTYTELFSVNNDPGGTGDGISLVCFMAPVTTALVATDNITFTFSPATTGVGACINVVSVSAGSTLALRGSTTGTANFTGDTVTLSSPLIGDLVLGTGVTRVTASPTNGSADTDTVNGSWSAIAQYTNNNALFFASQYKVVTADGSQSYTYACDRSNRLASAIAAFYEIPGITDYTLEQDGGTYEFTGEITGLFSGRLISNAAGDYEFVGSTATLSKVTGYSVFTALGQYQFDGADLNFLRAVLLSTATASYDFVGGDMTFAESNRLMADEGAYAFAGTDLNFLMAIRLVADSAAYTFGGGDLGYRITEPVSNDVTELYVVNRSKRRFWEAVRAKEVIDKLTRK